MNVINCRNLVQFVRNWVLGMVLSIYHNQYVYHPRNNVYSYGRDHIVCSSLTVFGCLCTNLR